MITHNLYYVAAQGDYLAILSHPGLMSRDQALCLAAWLVAMVEPLPGDTKFGDVLEEVMAK